jgi:fluoride exporter
MIGVLAVAAGGAAGSVCRYLIGLAALRLFGPAFPYGTVAVNVFGSFVMGVLAVAIGSRADGGERATLLLMTGFLGGFTTFSAFSLDVVRLAERGDAGLAVLYGVTSVSLSLAALAAGLAVARALGG